MTELELDGSRDEAIQVVEATLLRMTDVISWEMDDNVIVVRLSGGATSFGERLFIEIVDETTADGLTRLRVTADRRFGLDATANPWKHKAAFLETFSDVRTTPASKLDAESPDPAARKNDPHASALNRTALVLGLLLSTLLLIAAAYVAVILFF